MNDSFISAFLLPLPVSDPIGNIPIFVAALDDVVLRGIRTFMGTP